MLSEMAEGSTGGAEGSVGAWPLRKLNPGDHGLRRWRRLMARTPSDPRCKMCRVPFQGAGRALRLAGYAPSRKNPNLCNTCFERAPLYGFDAEVGILFADVRGYTSLVEALEPEEAAALLNRFYRVATDVLLRADAIIDKLVGDEVMAIFWPALMAEDHFEVMVEAAEELVYSVTVGGAGHGGLPLGAGLSFGDARMGNVGAGEVKDFTAVGDVVNTAARLQAQAKPGQLVLSERVYAEVSARYPDAEAIDLELKGKSAAVRARVLDLAGAPVAVRQ
jgi:adenylate cyclase